MAWQLLGLWPTDLLLTTSHSAGRQHNAPSLSLSHLLSLSHSLSLSRSLSLSLSLSLTPPQPCCPPPSPTHRCTSSSRAPSSLPGTGPVSRFVLRVLETGGEGKGGRAGVDEGGKGERGQRERLDGKHNIKRVAEKSQRGSEWIHGLHSASSDTTILGSM